MDLDDDLLDVEGIGAEVGGCESVTVVVVVVEFDVVHLLWKFPLLLHALASCRRSVFSPLMSSTAARQRTLMSMLF